MHVKPRLAARVAALGVGLAAVLVPLAGATAAHAAAASITVTPNTGLTDAQTVSVTGTSFTASEHVSLVECSALSLTGCDSNVADVGSATTGADGSLAATDFTVHTGTIGDGTCAAGSSSCFILVANDAHDEIAMASLTFAAAAGPAITVTPNTSLHDADSVSVSGTGFEASEGLTLVECSALTATGCDSAHAPVTATTGADGSLAATAFVVHTGAIGDGTCAAGSSTCFILATNAAHSENVQGTLTFAAATVPGKPTATATPAAGVKTGDTITVHGTHFTPGASIAVLECSGLSQATCDVNNVVPATASPTGTVDATIVVHTGKVGTGSCAATSSNCLIAVANEGDTTQVASAPIGFGPQVYVSPSTGLKAGQTVTVSGAGYPASANLYVLQCGAKPSATACNAGAATPTKTSASGTFSGIKIKLVSKAGSATCDSSHPCLIEAAEPPPAKVAGSRVITFAKLPTVKTATAAKASAKKVSPKKKFTISGTVKAAGKGVSGLKTSLYVKSGSKWKKISTFTTKAGGKFKSGKLKGPKKSAKYEVKTAKQAHGGKEYLASNSKIITVKK